MLIQCQSTDMIANSNHHKLTILKIQTFVGNFLFKHPTQNTTPTT